MLNSLPVRLVWHSFNWLTRLVIVVSATVAVLIALAIIALRYWILPDIEQYHDQITTSFAYAIGNPVTIGKIEGDWQGIMPRLDFSDVRILDKQRQPALILKRVQGSLSWMSLLTAQLRLASLEIDRPELLVRRDVNGKVFIGGVALSKEGGENGLSDWLLHQSRVVVRDALIVWVDEFRDARPLILRQVNVRIESLFNHHRFALHALPPEELATPLDVRGDFHGASFDDLQGWHGTLFTQLDFTDLTAWRDWLDLPKEFNLGRGALRGWVNVEEGKVNGVTADLAMYNVVARLAPELPEMDLTNLQGRAAWHELQGGFEVSTKGLALRMQNGIELQPTDFYFRTEKAGNEIRANLLQLETINKLAKFIPIGDSLRAQLDAYAPRGKVSNLDAQWQGSPERLSGYKIKGHFEDLAVTQTGKMPGFSGLTFDVDGNESSGKLSVNSRQMIVDAPGVMREPLSFATLTGQAGWKRERGELSINVDNIAVTNDDMAGNLFGSYQTKAGTRGVLDLTGKLTRGDIRRAARYTPLIALDKEGNDWLNGALLAGHTEDFRIRIKGNLSDFPLDGTKDAIFQIDGHARDAVMEFDKNWPRIEKISGEFSINGNKLEVRSPSAIIAGARLQNVTVTLPDMMSKDLSLEINGEALAASNTFLDFIQESPVRGYIDGFTDGMRASGNGHLDLSLHIPLLGGKPVKVSGTFKVQDNDIDLGKGVPMLLKTRGALSCTESGMHANGISAEILGGPAIINLQTAEGGAVHATLKGRNNIDVLRKLQPNPMLDYLHGSAAWDADISVKNKSAQVIINSNLQGISSSLPQPFSKRADEVMTLHVESNPVMILPKHAVARSCPEPCPKVEASVAEGQDVITARLGDIFSARLLRRDENGVLAIKRGVVNFGAGEQPPESRRMQKTSRGKDGVWLVGSLPVLSIQGWEGLAGGGETSAPELPIAGINLHIEKLTGYGQSVSALQIDASRRGDGLAVQLSSDALEGEVIWEPHGYETGSLIRGRLTNLQWSSGEPAGQSSPPAETVQPALPGKNEHPVTMPHSQPHPGNLPAFDVRVENFEFEGKQVGHFELVGHPEGKAWRMRRLNITNPDGTLVGDGVWSDTEAGGQTQVNLLLDISDAGKILGRSGYPNTVKGGSGKLAANLSWVGTPADFSLATLNGTLKLDTGNGRFLKMDTGAGKLLSVLSLQDLPKHVALGFTDVFSEGFQFDSINGNASIKNGVIDTQDFHIDGSSAKVTMKGSVDLNRETQDLRVKVLPTLGNSVSLIGVFAISPVVGIGSLIANKILGNPLDKLVSFEYNVNGTWSDPNVVKIGGVQSQAKPINPSEQERK
ncbi:MAG: DUF3971 domain-containing protein [Gallionella sp.]